MAFFSSLRKSLYDVKYYHHEGQGYTFWKAVWRYMRIMFIVFFIIGTIGMIVFAHFFTKENITKVTGIAKNAAISSYPTGLVVDISAASGLTTNATGPIVFSNNIARIFSGMMMKDNNGHQYKGWNKEESNKNILVIDTKATGDISLYNTYALLTNTQLIVQTKPNEKRVYDIATTMKDNPPVHITQDIFNTNIETLSNNIVTNEDKIIGTSYAILAVVALVILFIGSFFVGLFTAIGLYFYALIVWVVSKILGTTYSYKQVYSMTVVGFTLPFVLRTAHMRVRLLVLCLIVGRVMYLHKKRKAS